MAWRRGQAYAQDLRDRVLAAEGHARRAACGLGSQRWVHLCTSIHPAKLSITHIVLRSLGLHGANRM